MTSRGIEILTLLIFPQLGNMATCMHSVSINNGHMRHNPSFKPAVSKGAKARHMPGQPLDDLIPLLSPSWTWICLGHSLSKHTAVSSS